MGKNTLMKITISLCLAIFVFTIITHPCLADDLILIEDFEVESYGKWMAEGDAFGKGPSEEDMVGVMGSRSAASTGRSGVGTLTSPPFIIERNAIYLLLGAIEVDGPPPETAVQLLVDGDVVRTTTPNRYHAMFWYSWDVADFKGKKARIRIVDKDTRGPVFIFVDHIVQSNVPAERPLLERTITVTKPILNFPLKTGAARHYIELVVDGKQVRAMDVELAKDDIDYWVVTDLTPWLGKELLMRTRNIPLLMHKSSIGFRSKTASATPPTSTASPSDHNFTSQQSEGGSAMTTGWYITMVNITFAISTTPTAGTTAETTTTRPGVMPSARTWSIGRSCPE